MAPAKSSSRGQRAYLTVFDGMLKAMAYDYVDCARYAMSGHSTFSSQLYTLNGPMFQSAVFCDHQLTQALLHYLTWFQDPSVRLVVGPGVHWHLRVPCKVRRYQDALWVTELVDIRAGDPYRLGDKITRINGHTLPELMEEVDRLLMSTFMPEDPEREDWSVVLAFAKHVTIERDGAEVTFKVVPGDSPTAERLRAKLVQDAAALVEGGGSAQGADPHGDQGVLGCEATSADADDAPVQTTTYPAVQMSDLGQGRILIEVRSMAALAADEALVKDLQASIAGASKLIIDVRDCDDGYLDDCLGLVPFILMPGASVKPADVWGEDGVVVNWSYRNLNAKLAELETLRPGIDPEDIAGFDAYASELEGLRNKGLVRDESSYYPEVTLSSVYASDAPEVILLADTATAGAAEWLVKAARTSGFAKVVGRATRGSLDNTCIRSIRLDDDFTLEFPTGKYLWAADGQPTLGRGIQPDIHIPWTPVFLDSDPDLACALA